MPESFAPLHVTVIGSGYVGLVSGVCLAELGHRVICVDQDAARIAALRAGKAPIYEPGLEAMMAHHAAAERLNFTTSLGEAAEKCDIMMIAVGTPSDTDGKADLRQVFAAVRAIAAAARGPLVIVTKSTVPVGMGRRIASLLREVRPDGAYEIASNPEFLREGSAIGDFMQPDRIVIGTQSPRAKTLLERLYAPLTARGAKLLHTGIETAELIKYAANSFLATKIAFINEMADLCEALGADVQEVAQGVGMDERIGAKFLQAGPGFGGSCFPKDMLALQHIAHAVGEPSRIIDTVIAINERRRHRMVEKIAQACGGSAQGRTLAFLGVTFKANTDDVRNSPAIAIAQDLLNMGASLRIYDPKGMNEAHKELSGQIAWCARVEDALRNADALVIATEWEEFRHLDLPGAATLMTRRTIVDLRNVLSSEQAALAGFDYHSIGRKPLRQNIQNIAEEA